MVEETLKLDLDAGGAFEPVLEDLDAQEKLQVSLDGFEGPLDLLLNLARDQKVDLAKISVLRLAEQYLAFIQAHQDLRIEIAADYLVMAAWLAYLKSKSLLPQKTDGKGAEEGLEAEDLKFQLLRLEAMRKASQDLMSRERLGLARFPRGRTEATPVIVDNHLICSLFDLLQAYAKQRGRADSRNIELTKSELYSFEAAVARLQSYIGKVPDWSLLQQFLPEPRTLSGKSDPGLFERSALANTFVAALQMVRQGQLEMRQEHNFGPLYLRSTPHMKQATQLTAASGGRSVTTPVTAASR